MFISLCESYFHQQRIAEEEKVWMASYNLEDDAQLWYVQVQRDLGTPSWRRFTELLHLRYGLPLRSNPLVACHRISTTVDYQERYEALIPRAGPLIEGQRVQIFTVGLLPPLNLDVEAYNPHSLAVAMSLACKLELHDQYVMPPPSSSLSRSQYKGILPAPTVCFALPAPAAPTGPAAQHPTAVDGRQVRRISQTEMED